MTAGQPIIEQARRMIRIAAARRDSPFGDLFGDPAWLILLHLFVREHEGLETCISSACSASMSPQPTALRYIEAMTRRGIILKRADQANRQDVSLFLSDFTKQELAAQLS